MKFVAPKIKAFLRKLQKIRNIKINLPYFKFIF